MFQFTTIRELQTLSVELFVSCNFCCPKTTIVCEWGGSRQVLLIGPGFRLSKRHVHVRKEKEGRNASKVCFSIVSQEHVRWN